MKFLIAFAAVAAVAVASPVQRALITPGPAGPTPIVDENGSPISIGPAILDLSPISVGPAIVDLSPVSVGPAIIETNPISVGPAMVDFPLPDGGVVTAPVINPIAVVEPVAPVEPSPVVIGEIPAGATPLVQIIVNVQSPESVVAPSPADSTVVEEEYVPGPVNIADELTPQPEPIIVVNPIVVDPIQVVEPVIPGPVNIADNIVVEPVVVGTPIIVAPAVVLPDELN